MKPHADASLGEQRCRPRTTRNRRARSAASSSRPRRTRWSCTPLLERLASMRHHTNTEALLRPPSTSMPRSCRTDRGGHQAVSDVGETSARCKGGAESGSRAHGRGPMDRHGKRPSFFAVCEHPPRREMVPESPCTAPLRLPLPGGRGRSAPAHLHAHITPHAQKK